MPKEDTRQSIMLVARALFADMGYNSVTMRDIAGALNISVGNLTYHFKKKEELLEAIAENMHSHYDPKPPPKDLYELDDMFKRTMKLHESNSFYYIHYTQFAQISERIRQIQEKVMTDYANTWKVLFENLLGNGLIKPEEHPGLYPMFIEGMKLMAVYGMQYKKLTEELESERFAYDKCAWSMMLPILSDEGRRIYYTEISLNLGNGA